MYKHYKKYIESSRKQTKYLKDNFSIDNMTHVLKEYTDKIQLVSDIPLKLPKLKKVNQNEGNIPKLKLPKLKKLNG